MMASRRSGKPYIWATWLSKLLGGDQCLWSGWFKAHFKYEKFEKQAEQLAEWNRDHGRLMRDRRTELEEAGWTVFVENQNEFKLEGETATVAGKPDIIATMPGHLLVVDGKTGRQRDSDIWQMLLYLFALPKSRPDLVGALVGELQYKRGDVRITVKPSQLTSARRSDLITMIRTLASDTPPSKAPSRHECERCNIGPQDCPERFVERPAATAVAAAGF
jgi:CRISPR/Cas system-associated exonuclease Cas4 (RecB family)